MVGFRRLANGDVVCLVNKCAQTGMSYNAQELKNHWANQNWKVDHDDQVKRGEILSLKKENPEIHWLWWVRRPLDRLISAWRFFTITAPDQITSLLGLDPYTDFDGFCRAACTVGIADAHLRPQTECASWEGIFLPTHIMRFDELTPWWEYIMGKPWDHTSDNASRRTLLPGDLQVHPVTLALIHRTYKQDFKYYDQAILFSDRSPSVQRHSGEVQDGIALCGVRD